VDKLNREFPVTSILLAGDFNQLSDNDVTDRTGITQIVHQPTRRQDVGVVDGVTAESLNRHYADISTGLPKNRNPRNPQNVRNPPA